MYGCPAEMPDIALIEEISKYGKIETMWRGEIPGTGIKNGTRFIKLNKLNEHIPHYMTLFIPKIPTFNGRNQGNIPLNVRTDTKKLCTNL